MYKYLGQRDAPHDRRDYLPGIPARDITDKEAKDRGWAETLKASPLYEETAAAKAKGESDD